MKTAKESQIETGYLYNARTGDVWCGALGWLTMPSRHALLITHREAGLKIQDEVSLGSNVEEYCFRVCEKEL